MVWYAFMEDEEVQALNKLIPTCPECKSNNVAWILWGYTDVQVIAEKLEKNEIVLGGCIVTDNDPKWECISCHQRWGERDE